MKSLDELIFGPKPDPHDPVPPYEPPAGFELASFATVAIPYLPVCSRCGAVVAPSKTLTHEIFHDNLDRRFES